MNAEQRRDAAKLDGEVAVAHRVHRILGELRSIFYVHKTEQSRDQLAVEWQGGAGNRAAAERTDVHPLETVLQPFPVACQHFHVSQQMMGEINRLRPLQVGVSGNQKVGVLFAQLDQRVLEQADVL